MPIKTYAPDLSQAINRQLSEPPAAQSSDEAAFFLLCRAPDYLDELKASLLQFIKQVQDRKIALITLGGTTVPLENNTVRFIDNFLAGTRGAVLAERFLAEGYAVVFVYRELSFMPYCRHFPDGTILDWVGDNFQIKPEHRHDWEKVAREYQQNKDRLLAVPFTTVTQYLYTLKMVCETLHSTVRPLDIVVYLAAAVSDFYIPENELPTHKIQSAGREMLLPHVTSDANGITLRLLPVPKFLARIVDLWCPGAFVVSFKLETDQDLLYPKCVTSLSKYHQSLVIGNLLQTRKSEVMFVWADNEYRKKVFKCSGQMGEIESIFVPELLKLHSSFSDG